ncbi:Fucose-1-phosphate guanylyltransferase [Exaiptasia diaphana]|nr:Fucose-1-phosphate guanylyltransferase [Exaiptasia diaphana]
MIYNHLKGTALNVILLNESKFYHIGTIAEYAHYFCEDPVFRFESSGHHEIHVSKTSKYSRSPNTVIAESSVLMHCHKNLPSHVGPKCVLDFCEIGESACVEKGCIITNVAIPEEAEVPENVFLMTACVKLGGMNGLFVTVGFGVEDDMKKTSKKDELAKLSYVGQPLDKVFTLLGISQVSSSHDITINIIIIIISNIKIR